MLRRASPRSSTPGGRSGRRLNHAAGSWAMIALGGTPEDLAQAVKRELEIWGPIVRAAGMVAD
jgi:hypothetical protein